MRTITKETIRKRVADILVDINHRLGPSMISALEKAREEEQGSVARAILDDLVENQSIAAKGVFPLCQDTGTVVVFAEVGCDLHLPFSLEGVIDEAVRDAYQKGSLRKSMVSHPFRRENTKDNTPAILHMRIVPGDRLRLRIAVKGAGSENMSRVGILKPTDGHDGVLKYVVDTVKEAGGRPCPPIIVGVGLGGNLEKSALMAKEALFRDLDDESPDADIAHLEQKLLDEINALDIGPMGVGGEKTCLAVKINTFPMHMASLPVAVNIQCHAARHKEVVL